jgi:carbamate kinase
VRLVVALGGNALLRRGEPLTAEAQRANVRVAAEALAPLAAGNELVISHGNGPQVGLLALQGGWPLDVLGAETEGMIGYVIEQELANALPPGTPLATLLTMVEVDPGDPAFAQPTKFVGPVYERAEAERLARETGWMVRPDGAKWRRVVPSPAPRRIFEIRPIRWLLERGAIVICAGGGGIPTAYASERRELVGVEAVVDKDACSELLARELAADLFVMATDVGAVFLDFGTSRARAIHRASPLALREHEFPAGSMGPKVEAACAFAEATGKPAAIGALSELAAIARGEKGTIVDRRYAGITYH